MRAAAASVRFATSPSPSARMRGADAATATTAASRAPSAVRTGAASTLRPGIHSSRLDGPAAPARLRDLARERGGVGRACAA